MPTPNVGFLRQWLNERDQSKLVTDEDLLIWLKPEFEQYALERFDDALLIESATIEGVSNEDEKVGWNKARSEIIRRFNSQE